MNIGIESTKQTIDSLLNGASVFIDVVNAKIEESNISQTSFPFCDMTSGKIVMKTKFEIIRHYSELQVGDEFFIKEEFVNEYGHEEDYIKYKNECRNSSPLVYWIPASEMTQEQSRYKGVVIGIEIKRRDCILTKEALLLGFKSEDRESPTDIITNKYPDNPYVFLYTVKKI